MGDTRHDDVRNLFALLGRDPDTARYHDFPVPDLPRPVVRPVAVVQQAVVPADAPVPPVIAAPASNTPGVARVPASPLFAGLVQGSASGGASGATSPAPSPAASFVPAPPEPAPVTDAPADGAPLDRVFKRLLDGDERADGNRTTGLGDALRRIVR